MKRKNPSQKIKDSKHGYDNGRKGRLMVIILFRGGFQRRIMLLTLISLCWSMDILKKKEKRKSEKKSRLLQSRLNLYILPLGL